MVYLSSFYANKKGFTLIEMLVVITILGVLSTIAIPAITQFLNEGEDEAKQEEMHNIQIAVVALLADANTINLDGADGTYDEVDTLAEVTAVTADNGSYSLASYILGTATYPFKQAYDISKEGLVTLD